ncbi:MULTISPECIES: type IV pilus biogenesis/stability protein PilW [Acidithiobacillus]|jgi:type IV pilus assembly protein PilF|uniref:Pilus assembly protein PilW n=2 Tax=Acidithiobacillus thiooxidans TaxID=930 RepID=A0A1C2IET3_ACITH|nr:MULTISPECIES: type IV pilus biogenesis/stability protein PilW [Acidithiobacillus]MDA8176345.1 type IV pilus biogenesis/stability protein PilW [Acidithiobacillus sp.]MDX5936189.1 type IV pilus biogenesis/stability protein PilW [Acidithiobacillus thiooxidans]OCX74507.1 pilus assembly protein PilW [Acidithiobacillus thiooxidans]OCX75938.1 pilus assembly protein PilW [Acidithiobacillus thiooxidans]OCX79899.1 pilus assembly protein PilW [Acidithiobacillus thiooxidans]
MKTDGMRFHKVIWIPGLLVVSALSGCGLFGSKSSPMTSDQQMAAFIAHEHKTRATDQGLQAPADDGKAKAGIYTSLGTAYLQDGHPRQAIRELQMANQADDSYADAYNVMGLAYEQLGQKTLARQAFEQALSLDAKNPEYRNNYGAFLVNTGDYQQAIVQLKQATADPLYSTPQFAWTNLAQAYAGLKDPVAARNALNRALYLLPNYPPALQILAEMDFKEGNVQAAYGHLQVVLAQEPDNASALLLAGQIAARQGRPEQAAALWQRCVNAAPYSDAGKKAQQLLLQHG